MKIYSEESLSSFKFWAGARDIVELMTSDELDSVEEIYLKDGISQWNQRNRYK